MMKVLGSLLAGCALFYLTGAHWMTLQTIAWTQMIITYSEDSTVLEAVQRTFSGKSPCSMCKSIQEEQKKQEQAAVKFALADKKIEALTPVNAALPCPLSTGTTTFFLSADTRSARSLSPETPPPRVA